MAGVGNKRNILGSQVTGLLPLPAIVQVETTLGKFGLDLCRRLRKARKANRDLGRVPVVCEILPCTDVGRKWPSRATARNWWVGDNCISNG